MTPLHCGIDLVSINRIQKIVSENPEAFLGRICTEAELSAIRQIESVERKSQKIAGLYALKEAFSKAIGTGIGSDLGFKDIIVSYDLRGKPQVTYLGEKFRFESTRWQISSSVSHEGDLLIAQVVIFGEVTLII